VWIRLGVRDYQTRNGRQSSEEMAEMAERTPHAGAVVQEGVWEAVVNKPDQVSGCLEFGYFCSKLWRVPLLL
jgi:hypothetical protein